MARSFPLARFGVVGRSGTIVVFSCNHFRALIWGLSFAKMLFSIFFPENAPQIGLSIPEETASLSYQRQRSPKRANESERAIKTRVQGGALVFFPPTFSKESRAPRRSRRAPGALRPKVASEPPTRRVPPPQPPAEEPTWMVSPSIPHPRGKHNSPTGAAPVFRPTPPWLGGPPDTAAGQTPCPPGRWAGPPPPPGGGRSP